MQADSRRRVGFGPLVGTACVPPGAAAAAVSSTPSPHVSEHAAGAWVVPTVPLQPVVTGTGLPLLDAILQLATEFAAAEAATAAVAADCGGEQPLSSDGDD